LNFTYKLFTTYSAELWQNINAFISKLYSWCLQPPWKRRGALSILSFRIHANMQVADVKQNVV